MALFLGISPASESTYPIQVVPCLNAMTHINGITEFEIIGATKRGSSCVITIRFNTDAQLEQYVESRKLHGLSPYEVTYKTEKGTSETVRIELHVSK